jgi:hypothetical protein
MNTAKMRRNANSAGLLVMEAARIALSGNTATAGGQISAFGVALLIMPEPASTVPTKYTKNKTSDYRIVSEGVERCVSFFRR